MLHPIRLFKEGLPLVQLYDMENDIGEKCNVQAEHPEIVKCLTVLLEKYVNEGRNTPGPAEKNDLTVDIWKKNKPHFDDDKEN